MSGKNLDMIFRLIYRPLLISTVYSIENLVTDSGEVEEENSQVEDTAQEQKNQSAPAKQWKVTDPATSTDVAHRALVDAAVHRTAAAARFRVLTVGGAAHVALIVTAHFAAVALIIAAQFAAVVLTVTAHLLLLPWLSQLILLLLLWLSQISLLLLSWLSQLICCCCPDCHSSFCCCFSDYRRSVCCCCSGLPCSFYCSCSACHGSFGWCCTNCHSSLWCHRSNCHRSFSCCCSDIHSSVCCCCPDCHSSLCCGCSDFHSSFFPVAFTISAHLQLLLWLEQLIVLLLLWLSQLCCSWQLTKSVFALTVIPHISALVFLTVTAHFTEVALGLVLNDCYSCLYCCFFSHSSGCCSFLVIHVGCEEPSQLSSLKWW